jgi:general secretion pathway protein D
MNMKNCERKNKIGRATLRALTAAIALTTAVASAQPTTEPTTEPTTAPSANGTNHNGAQHGVTTQPGGGLLLNFKDASIDNVLDELSAAAGFIVVKEVKPEGRVTLLSKQALTRDDAVSLLNTVMKNAGYAAIQQGRILKIVQRDRAKKANIPVRSGADPLKIDDTDELVTQVIPLRYASATQLKTDLQPLVNPDADFTANASSNALVMTDTSTNIRRIVQIVAALDTHLADSTEVKVFQLQYADAASTAKMINDLFQDSSTPRATQGGGGGGARPGGGGGFGGFGGGGFGGGGFGGGGFGGGGAGGPGGGFRGLFGAGGGNNNNNNQQDGLRTSKVQASSDDRTNTLVVTGPTDTLNVIAQVVKQLDSNPEAESTTFVYKLKNADSLNIEAVCNLLFNGTSSGQRNGTSSQTRQQQLSADRSSLVSSTGIGGGTTGTGTTNRNTTALNTGVNGGAANRPGGNTPGGVTQNTARTAYDLAGQVAIIADADTNSVLVRTAPKNYEQVKRVLDELDRPVAQVLIKVLVAEVRHDNTSDIGSEFSALNLRSGPVTTVTGTGANAVTSTVNTPNGQGQREGTQFNVPNFTNGTGGIIAITESNFSATIHALETQGKLDVLSRPYILASDNQLASITVGQEVPYVTNSQLTDTGQTINTIQYSDIGILLDVIPHINPDGLVILDVAPEISAISSTSIQIAQNVNATVFDKRSAQSRVEVQDGQTAVIGGLMEDQANVTNNKVPILGDIPFIGPLFQRKTTDKTKTELLIFLTPHVASRPDLLKGMGEDELRHTKLVPNAISPGAFEEQMEGMNAGAAATQPAKRP